MFTALMILLAVILVVGLGFMVLGLMRGCLFTWIWFACGGLESGLTLLGEVVGEILKGLAE